MELEPVPDEPALMADDILVVADLHIGLEEELQEKGIRVPSRAEGMARKLMDLAARRGATRLVILGDVKHLVPKMASRERRDVYVFFRDLASTFKEIYIAQGNHDGMRKHIVPRSVRFKPAYGFRIEDVGFCHGHAWPYKKVMEGTVLLMGHNHPAAAFRDALGSRQVVPCWMRVPFLRKHKRYPRLPREAIVVPSFNELCGGMPVNDVRARFIGPLFDEALVLIAMLVLRPFFFVILGGWLGGAVAGAWYFLRYLPPGFALGLGATLSTVAAAVGFPLVSRTLGFVLRRGWLLRR